jgi:MFS family permease
VNYNNHTSLYNWVEQLDLVCDKGSQIGLIGSLYFAGWSSTILFLPWLADKIGRRWIFFFSVLVTSFACLGLYLSQNLNFTISLMFIVGMANSGRVMVGFLFASEFMTPKWQVIYGTAFIFIDCATGMIIILYFDFVNKHYIYIAAVAGVSCSLSTLLVLTYSDESPLW